MLFCSEKYLLFFALIFTGYWALPWQRARVWLLLGASFYFYASWNKWLALLITGTTVMDYLVARGMDAADKQGVRRTLLVASLAMNLGLLVYFKYANFFLQSLEENLRSAGLEASLPVLSVILPVGISFYTFEAINYTVDVYRRKIPAEKNLANLMLFILFFPHLVAGPIVRARDFLPQTTRAKRFDWARVELGLRLLAMGLFKKLAIADRMAQFVDPVYSNPTEFGTGAAWAATLAYWLQIYCDFSGYSDMAVGSAHLLGYKLVQNFDMPYASKNVAELWRRWHISLSTWLRDYLFIPLGGSQRGEVRLCLNLLVVMTVCGLWHGATWMCVGWGASQGLFLIVHRIFARTVGRFAAVERALTSVPGTIVRILFTNLSFIFGLVIFRSSSFEAAGQMFLRLATPVSGWGPPLDPIGLWGTVALVVACHIVGSRKGWHRVFDRLPAPLAGAAQAGTVCLALLLAPQAGQIFIYFQF